MDAPDVPTAIELQAAACERLGSPLYARLLRELLADDPRASAVRSLLDGRSPRPVHDAIVLRLLGALHRLAIRGDAPDLAAAYPSAGGQDRGEPLLPGILAAVEHHHDEIVEALGQQVQTNEVGRSAALVVGYSELHRRFGHPLRISELGASGGLNLRFDRFRFEAEDSVYGDPSSPVRFRGWWAPGIELEPDIRVGERRGCDLAPLDASDDATRERLLSFVWPDQEERFRRLRAALDVVAAHPVAIDCADAGDWLGSRLADDAPDETHVVVHSIVWQYLPRATKDRIREVLHAAGSRASVACPLAWLRLEPAGTSADLRLTTWPGGEERVLALAGYHGHPIVLPAPTDRARSAG